MLDLESVKRRLRISHSKLDDEITECMEIARLELIRSGVSEHVLYGTYPLADQAVLTYVQMQFCNDQKMAERFQQSFDYQCDNLRKSSEYGGAQNV